LPDFTRVAQDTIAVVTNISSLQVVRRRTGLARDPFFRYFFGDSQNLSRYRERPSLGSGVIVGDDGYILTNAHVVGRQTAGITVTLADDREFAADLVGRDESTDIALLRIEASGLPTIPWGDSSELRVAEWVLAVGNPFQLNQTVTLGIVSAVGRDNLGVARYEDFIQTDAAINPGNSGGALINARGELVGINTAILSDSGGYQGVGFAVPSNLASRVMKDLVAYGEVKRGSFGYVDVRELTPRLARELGVPDTQGVVIWRIHQDSAAAQVGLDPGDVIVAFDGQLVESPSDYNRRLSDAAVGSIVRLDVIRAGERIAFDVMVSQARAR
jgi:serine protease Do